MQEIAIVEESIELLPRIGQLISSSPAPGVAGGALTNAQRRAVSLLYHRGDLTIGEFAAGLGIGMPAASELVERLQDDALVFREVDPADRRRAIVGLTEQALDQAHQIHDQRRIQVRRALDQLEPDERPIFLKSLRALATALDDSGT